MFSILLLLLLIITTILLYFKWKFTYWKRHNVPYLTPKIPLGSIQFTKLKNQPYAVYFADAYKSAKDKGLKYVGIYLLDIPILMLIDPDLINRILINDFSYFGERGLYYNIKVDPVSAHHFTVNYDLWKQSRAVTALSFKNSMLQDLINVCKVSNKELLEVFKESSNPIDIIDLSGKYMANVILEHAFGIECNAFNNPTLLKEPLNEAVNKSANVWFLIATLIPNLFRWFKIKTSGEGVNEFFNKIRDDSTRLRHSKRNDFMQLLIDMVNKDKSTAERVPGLIYSYLVASYDTTLLTISYCLFELAKNLEIQNKIRKELKDVLGNEDINYENLKKMEYLEHVIEETLRKYPVGPVLNRSCMKDYPIPDSEVVLKKGTKIVISSYGLHYDEEYYPNPNEFNPDRFLEGINSTFLGFGLGPRSCPGNKFGITIAKSFLLTLLSNYEVHSNSKTPNVLTFNPTSFVLTSKDIIYIDIKRIKI